MQMLRKLKVADVPYMLEWMHDQDINCNFKMDFSSMRKADVIRFLTIAEETEKEGTGLHRAIIDEQDIYLGTISLKNIDSFSCNAEYAISLRKCAHGRGVALKATQDILKIAFEQLGLTRVYLNVLSENIRANKFYLKFGFQLEGEFRKHVLINGNYKNLKWYSILKEEFESRYIYFGK